MEALLKTISFQTFPAMAMLLACVLAEYASPMTKYPLRDRFPGAWFIALYQGSILLLVPPLQTMWSALGVAPLIALDGLSAPATFIILLLLRDLLNYVQHRVDHLILWPIHSVHHSATDLHAANGFTHPLQIVSEFFWIGIPLSLINTGGIGMPIALVLTVTLQSIIIHSPLRVHLGPLRRVIVDSRFHRIHHSMEERHFEKNFGTVFTLWDQLFGTAYFPAPDEWPETGVAGLAAPRTMWAFLSHPVRFLVVSRAEARKPPPHQELVATKSMIFGEQGP